MGWTQHINGRRHRKYAVDDSHFSGLDSLLSRVRRRTKGEAEQEKRRWAAKYDDDDEDEDEDANMLPVMVVGSDDDVRWGEWVEDGEEL